MTRCARRSTRRSDGRRDARRAADDGGHRQRRITLGRDSSGRRQVVMTFFQLSGEWSVSMVGRCRSVIAALNRDFIAAVNDPEVKEKLAQIGLEVSTGSPAALTTQFANDLKSTSASLPSTLRLPGRNGCIQIGRSCLTAIRSKTGQNSASAGRWQGRSRKAAGDRRMASAREGGGSREAIRIASTRACGRRYE